MDIMTIITWATAIVTAASAIAAMTPTPKDDNIIKWNYKALDFAALNFGKAKDKGDDGDKP